MRSTEAAAGLALTLLVACGDQSGMSPAPLQLAGFSGIPTMNPGQDCYTCHIASGNAHRRVWNVSGTVFSDPLADVDAGVAGAEVLITDNDGKQITLVTNEAGNFYTGESVTFPLIDVQIQRGKRRMRMALDMQQGGGNCNACHTVPPMNGAAGRLFIPAD
jgi:hypothetical protein